MSLSQHDAEIAAFIRQHGVTRCPTACVVRTQGSVSSADREQLQKRAAEVEIRRGRRFAVRPFGKNPGEPRPS